ncbi:alpha-E domain-containing protein [Paraurantiacibacter namhicola]|uniref:DUF403 domain-containing protein n=1 Tax=Paraurantiacibacter namhicola TaxID=645517 RepID=A0A1C7D7F1_9SPHN|nr:alpha-E domain-containing protein [Paraurantiacibacter namhicola]ANU07378.1 hypothetical protein A6F65_01069 [Paraurantiacibacter namhicola]
MLGRTASGVFWLFRYLERAENTARLLEAGLRMALTRESEAASREWRSVVTTLGLKSAYEAQGGDYTNIDVCDFVLRASSNSESVLSMFERARTNARGSRTSLTREVWEAVNEGWMNLCELLDERIEERDLGRVLAAIRRESTIARGATHGSMMRNQIYSFARMGTFIERADNTARILDVKYYVLLPSLSYIGSAVDTGQWDNVLRSLSGERAYRWLNAGQMSAKSIADFLVLDSRFPRSLAFCYGAIRENMSELAKFHGEEREAHALMREADMRLFGQDIDAIFDRGLHQFILDFLATNRRISDAIAVDYRFAA